LKISFNDIAENKRWSLLFLTGLGALFFLGIGETHLFDWDEINFAESAREMMQTGDYLRVQVNYGHSGRNRPSLFGCRLPL